MNLREYVQTLIPELGVEYVAQQLAHTVSALQQYQGVNVSPQLFVERSAFGWDADEAAEILAESKPLRITLENLKRSKFPRPSLVLPYPAISPDAFWAYVGIPAPTPTPTP